VDEAQRVGGGQASPGLDEALHHHRPAPAVAHGRSVLAQPLAERVTIDELHRDEHAIVDHARLVDLHHVGVREPGEHLGLSQQAVLGASVLGGLGSQQLDRHASVELLVVGCMDLAHAPGPQA
jgi:hypothetical protein